MSWLSRLIPDRRQRLTSVGCLLVFAVAVAVAVLTSRAEDWQPESLVIAMFAFGIASELTAFRHDVPARTPWVLPSTAPMALSATLLGPAPTLAIGVTGMTIDALYRRATIPNMSANLANYGLFMVSGGLISRWLEGAWGVTPEDAGFALLIFLIYTYIVLTSFLINSVTGLLLYRDPLRDQFNREMGSSLGAEAPTSLLTAGIGYAYGAVGLAALGLLAIVQLTFQYLSYSLITSQERAEALQQRADELASLHATMKDQTDRLAQLSASRGRLVGQVLQAEETERRRLAESLHDEALQELLAARQGLSTVIDAKAERARDAMGRAIDQLRDAISNLHPAVLEHAGLAAALQEVADHQAERAGFQAEVDVDPRACGPLDSLLFVLAREQLTNIAKHAQASDVVLAVSQSNNSVVMEVTDNGCGMDSARRRKALEQGHIGLASSAERVEALGGTLEIDSEPGRGTSIRTTLPLESS